MSSMSSSFGERVMEEAQRTWHSLQFWQVTSIVLVIVIIVLIVAFLLWWFLDYSKKTQTGGGNLVGAPSKAICNTNADCASGACGHQNGDPTSPMVCCNNGAGNVLLGGQYYCADVPVGQPCTMDEQCGSFNCINNKDRLGTCAKSPVGDLCTSNSDCTNGACGRPSAASPDRPICCPSGSLTNYLGWDYCTGEPTGTTCLRDEQCASGRCNAGTNGRLSGTCA